MLYALLFNIVTLPTQMPGAVLNKVLFSLSRILKLCFAMLRIKRTDQDET